MERPLVGSGSVSSDYFGSDDPGFIEALQTAVLPGDIQLEETRQTVTQESSQQRTGNHEGGSKKRARSNDDDDDEPRPGSLASATNSHGTLQDADSDVYGASRFGDMGQYMRRKRAKLQIQNTQLDSDGSGIFKGLAIYINGWTEPSIQDLRQLIVKHGGVFHPYLDRKAMVTHIITCSLTPAKMREFKQMKVARPDWLVESAEAGVLLPWHKYIFKPVEAAENATTVQKSIANVFMSHPPAAPTSSADEEALEPPPSTQPRRPAPIYTTDPRSAAEAARVPHYAADASNVAAARAMANPEWRSAHTSVAADFIEGYYKNSRLHHLSTWKAELKGLVMEAQERAESGLVAAADSDDPVGKIVKENVDGARVSMRGEELVMKSPSKNKGKGKEKESDGGAEKVIMHCDFDCFFVSAGLITRPHLRGKPVVVCHSQGTQGGASSTSEIASASYEARKFGIKNGMSLQQARKLCPDIQTIPYEFEQYKTLSLQFYTILMSHADDLQAVSVDEALIEVTSSVARIKHAASEELYSSPVDPAKDFAEAIRSQVRATTGCEVSIGIGHNILLARLATRRAKPAGSFHLLPASLPQFLAPLDIDDLHGFGSSTRQKAQDKLGVTTLGELSKKSKAVLCDALGKSTGETLYNAIRGIDDRKLESDKPRKSVSCEINYGIRFENNDQAEVFVFQMAEEVARRLNAIGMLGRSLTLKIMKRDPDAPVEPPKFLGHGACDVFNKQMPLAATGGRATSDDKVIGEHAWRLLKSWNFDPKELRGIGIQIQKLESSSLSAAPEPGQARLPFKPVDSHAKAAASADESTMGYPQIRVEAPSPAGHRLIHGDPVAGPSRIAEPTAADAQNLDLPSFSQVDMSVFDALPAELRAELETEYKRRSASPAVEQVPPPVAGPSRARLSEPPAAQLWPPRRITVKGMANVKRITQQLAPRSRSSISPRKSTLFSRRAPGAFSVIISDAELRKLDIDPEVFAALPPDLQREQLSAARAAKAPGGPNVIVPAKRKILKPPSRSPSAPIRRRPPPQARFPPPPTLKQQGKAKGEKLYFTDTEDVQGVIGKWVDGFREHPPNAKDVDFFARWLVRCVDGQISTDVGVEKAVAVVKWWLVLLRRHWGEWEKQDVSDATGDDAPARVGKAWWRAFRDVKSRMDVVARKKFGGSLSLK
ncbi:hypothetical protein PLICRDRAFT_110060 [Plicaturopsis crispa FD-325 SS-3]|nr:hypothetical protein PLICRDRAFT_110060 [Plicaturopsis crispa FD-325 SS-3]